MDEFMLDVIKRYGNNTCILKKVENISTEIYEVINTNDLSTKKFILKYNLNEYIPKLIKLKFTVVIIEHDFLKNPYIKAVHLPENINFAMPPLFF